MTTTALERRNQPWFRRLYLPAYSPTDAAKYTKASVQTVASWHYRETAILPRQERGKPLTYLELVEVAFVAFFRQIGVSMQRIRRAREYVAQNFTAEYPFAEYVFKTEGAHVLMNYAQFEDIPEFERVIVADRNGQLAWEQILGEKFAEFDYEYELALRWHPAGRLSSVVIDPRIAFGAPMVSGLPTWVVHGRYKAGETIPEITAEFGISQRAVEDALGFEGVKLNGHDHSGATASDIVLGQERS